ncbi:MAG: ABC transporter ATP-binding protein, partial [Pseudomonadota bacterium]|nr:ABC transporter ATP-binding protein [Pseudomonadota bacterium]
PPKSFFGFLWASTQGLRPFLLAMTILTAAIGIFEALLFAMMGQLVDWLSNIPAELLWTQEKVKLMLLAGIIIGSIGLIALQTTNKHQVMAGNFPMRLRWNFHRLMLSQSMGFYQDEFAGRVSAKVMQTALAIREVWMITADIVVFVMIYFVTIILVLGQFDLWMMLPLLLWLVGFVLAVIYFIPRLSKISKKQADARSLMTGRITDAYSNISTVKLFSHAGREAGYVRWSMQEFLKTVHKQMRLVSGFEIVNHTLSMLLLLGTVGIALWLWTQNQLGIGAVAAGTAMALRLNGMSHWIMWNMATLFEQIGTVQDGMNMLSKPQTVLDQPNAQALQVKQGQIDFQNISFAYGGEKQVLDDLSLRIQAGEKIGLVGRSGAGKSTLIHLLLRFYDTEQGQILIDGQDIREVTQESLRAQIGMVTQDTSLLHRSVTDNIRYGRPDASQAEVEQAAQRAEAHEFILGLSDAKGHTGYESHVGERGVKLSGGQRQRIAIARVMLKDAPILLLDEATSALDSEVEAAIQDSLYRLMEGKTVIAIAHRLSTIAAMDRLVVLDQGRIVEQGTHQQLLAKHGIYARLWAHQSGGFLAEDVVL